MRRYNYAHYAHYEHIYLKPVVVRVSDVHSLKPYPAHLT